MTEWKMHTLENDRKITHWKMTEKTHRGIWKTTEWKMHTMENGRKITHWKMIENALLKITPWKMTMQNTYHGKSEKRHTLENDRKIGQVSDTMEKAHPSN